VQAQALENLLRGVFQSFALANVSDEQEVALGGQIVQRLVARGEIRVSNNPRANSIVRRVGERIARTSERSNLPYRFYVATDRNVNAFSIMGGYIFVTTGLLNNVRSEGELAGVLAHEVAHVVARHSLEQMRQAALAQGIANAVGGNVGALVGIGAGLYQRQHSRDDEYEADRLGVFNMARAGYPPQALPAFLSRLQGSRVEFLSTHPSSQNRVARLNRIIQSENLAAR
jgi:predicted Zn-dependent protease